jgi:hypothetical protein
MSSPIIYRDPGTGATAIGSDDNADYMATLVWRPRQPGRPSQLKTAFTLRRSTTALAKCFSRYV